MKKNSQDVFVIIIIVISNIQVLYAQQTDLREPSSSTSLFLLSRNESFQGDSSKTITIQPRSFLKISGQIASGTLVGTACGIGGSIAGIGLFADIVGSHGNPAPLAGSFLGMYMGYTAGFDAGLHGLGRSFGWKAPRIATIMSQLAGTLIGVSILKETDKGWGLFVFPPAFATATYHLTMSPISHRNLRKSSIKDYRDAFAGLRFEISSGLSTLSRRRQPWFLGRVAVLKQNSRRFWGFRFAGVQEVAGFGGPEPAESLKDFSMLFGHAIHLKSILLTSGIGLGYVYGHHRGQWKNCGDMCNDHEKLPFQTIGIPVEVQFIVPTGTVGLSIGIMANVNSEKSNVAGTLSMHWW